MIKMRQSRLSKMIKKRKNDVLKEKNKIFRLQL